MFECEVRLADGISYASNLTGGDTIAVFDADTGTADFTDLILSVESTYALQLQVTSDPRGYRYNSYYSYCLIRRYSDRDTWHSTVTSKIHYSIELPYVIPEHEKV